MAILSNFDSPTNLESGFHSDTPLNSSTSDDTKIKPAVIGIFGIQGSGKSHLLKKLKELLGEDDFAFYEGSEVLGEQVPGGLDEFKKLDEEMKSFYREVAIRYIQFECAQKGKTGFVAGHFMFWNREKNSPVEVLTDNDWAVFTHVFYLDTPTDTILAQRIEDNSRLDRGSISLEQLDTWKQMEKRKLRFMCYNHDIPFMLVSPAHNTDLTVQIRTRWDAIREDSMERNLARALSKLDDSVHCLRNESVRLERILVFDADKTLCAEDSGELFWQLASQSGMPQAENDISLKTLFKSKLSYSYGAFRQVALLYEDLPREELFEPTCDDVARSLNIFPELKQIFDKLSENLHVGVIVITCGVCEVWEKKLQQLACSDRMKVIGATSGLVADSFVVTPEVKAALVERLRDKHQLSVWVFGDSPLDLPMMKEAHEAIVVVGEEGSRSQSMEAKLSDAIELEGFRARQLLLPRTSTERLKANPEKLPVIELTDEFTKTLFQQRPRILAATDRLAAKVLMTATRNADVGGPALRHAHSQVGWYLATEFLTELIGVEQYFIQHVQGNKTPGYRLRDEKLTVIVPLMRGGEPMAFGVIDACTLAQFVHAKKVEDLQPQHVKHVRTILLVDSVVNSGKSVVEFVEHARHMNRTARIVILAGVVQKEAIEKGELSALLKEDPNLSLVALRFSENKFTGKGTTDTGHRLFNTTYLD
ncbi:hypothetical protein EJ08DRAFT_709196 [Tothia fuscella]|uniref:Phosphoribosyltransferase domain-containing protein n=1 Tax=Tothia fuscella TaxID=1048955 RepID=A0A9P4TZZ9_9PEZI|nr:hypothetical protein EJ08DRAFT_709196 [Tothia fuscella]